MANICFNIVKIVGEETRIAELKTSLDKCLENNICSFRDVAETLKLTISDDIYCRGDISYVDEVENDVLTLQLQNNWNLNMHHYPKSVEWEFM